MPVLPLVASISVSPGRISPRRSAFAIMESAGRSFTEPAGLLPSSLASTTFEVLPGMRCSRTSGVLPTKRSRVAWSRSVVIAESYRVAATKSPARGGARRGSGEALLFLLLFLLLLVVGLLLLGLLLLVLLGVGFLLVGLLLLVLLGLSFLVVGFLLLVGFLLVLLGVVLLLVGLLLVLLGGVLLLVGLLLVLLGVGLLLVGLLLVLLGGS